MTQLISLSGLCAVCAVIVALTAMKRSDIMIEQPHNTMCEQTTDILSNDQALLVLANSVRVR